MSTNQGDEKFLDTNDNVKCFEPDFEPSLQFVSGGFRYLVIVKREVYSANDRGGQDREVIEDEIEVTQEQWRDITRLHMAAQFRCLRSMLSEQFDTDIEESVAHSLLRIANGGGE